MALPQKSVPPNPIYKEALQWYERQEKYKIEATLKGKLIEMKLFVNGELYKTNFEPFDSNFINVNQKKIIDLYNYETAKND